MGIVSMAKKSKPLRKGPPEIAVTIRGSEEWKTWIEELAEFCRTDVAKLFDAAVIEYAKDRGFSKDAPKR